MNKKLVAGMVVVLVMIGAIVLWQDAQEKPTTVRIGYLNIVASLPLFVAEEKGFLAEEGVHFETRAIATSNQLVDAIISDNLDCFIEAAALPVLAVELQSPGRLKVFSASEITKNAPFDALLVRKESKIQGIGDLTGKKIGVFPGSTATNLLKKFLLDSNVDVSTINFVPIPPPNQLPALVSGSIDALHCYEPTTSIALIQGTVRKIHGSVYADMLSPNPQGVAAISSSFVKQYPEVSSKVIRALERAMVFLKENDKEARDIMMNRMQLTEQVSGQCVFLYMLPHKMIDPTVFQKYSDMLTELGELSGKVSVNNLIYQ